MKTVRTSESRFEAIPDFPYEPQYRDWQGMRLAHYDVGDGPAVLLQHGEPALQFLARRLHRLVCQVGETFTDRRGELEAVTTEADADHDGAVAIEHEVVGGA